MQSSIVGTAIQCSGTILVAVLIVIILRVVRRSYLAYWAAGWSALSLALLALVAGFLVQRNEAAASRSWHQVFFGLYCFGEYAAVALWIAGCRELRAPGRTPNRAEWSVLVPAAMTALLLACLIAADSPSFNGLMAFHALVMACLFSWAFVVLFEARKSFWGAGVVVMLVALALLTVEFIHYAVLCGACHLADVDEVFPHLNYSSLYDFVLLTILAFGMVMVVMERVQADLETANRELRSAGVRLRELAQFDQMTGALNRNAFEALLSEVQHEGASLAGCVAVLDIDNLKPINDTLGHKTGDRAIQLVAQAVRAIIRPNDLLFRWGGDEFLILWLGNIKKADAAERLRGLNESLQAQAVKSGFDLVLTPSVSWGLATFASSDGLDAAVQRADRAMYEIKMSRRSTPTVSFP